MIVPTLQMDKLRFKKIKVTITVSGLGEGMSPSSSHQSRVH